MARTKRQAGPGTRRVEERLVEGAREFVTIGPEHPTWRPGRFDENGNEIDADVVVPEGAFVRVEPPRDATDDAVAAVREAAKKAGALRVTVLPRRRAAVVRAPKERRPHRRARDVVTELVAEANVREEDRESLRELTEAIMAARGI